MANIIEEHIKSINSELPVSVSLVAVSKFHHVDALLCAYNAGQRIFGESRVQELCAKVTQMPTDVEWHFIGHLQTNKVRLIIPHVSLIHSVDSLRLLETINSEALKAGRIIDVLLQLHVAQEETKFGFTCDDCMQLLTSEAVIQLNNVRICGVMGMATNTDDEQEIRKEFQAIRQVFDHLKKEAFADASYFTHVSMGMSNDYKIAIEEGSTMIRIGSTIFGVREY
ncbi:MAG: YggS family pyridoxal phosphate-dependent enzyme [Muribaculaceae bacterium]